MKRAWNRCARTRLCSAVVALALLPTSLAAQDPESLAEPTSSSAPFELLEANVTAVSGGSVYLDRGWLALIEPGDRLLVYALGGGTVETTITAVSKTSSRADLPPGGPAVEIGDRAEILLPVPRLEEAADDPEDREEPVVVPDHPEWSHPPEDWDGTTPLLAPAFSRPPEERETLVHGRFYTQFSGTWDKEHDNEFYLGRIGTEVFVENPFKEGGELHFDGEIFRRESILDQGDDQKTDRYRIDRFSYRWGGTRDNPQRIQAGRFLQHNFPELGVLDGLEYSQRTNRGNVVGGSFGFMPSVDDAVFSSAQDLQASIFYRTDPQENLDLGLAYQNTWHEGDQDRNLLLATLDYHPDPDFTLFASAWLDYYGPNDEIKSDGFELTEARVNGIWRLDERTGVSADASQMRWPEMLRQEFSDLMADEIENNHVTRVGLSGWRKLTDRVKLDGRVSRWDDEDEGGTNANLRIGFRDTFYDGGELSFAVFRTDGASTEGNGLRITATKTIDATTFGSLAWELARNKQDLSGAATQEEDQDRQALRASLNTSMWKSWTFSVFAERRFGDEQDSYNLGVYAQERF